ncbi:MAG: PfkB family carbohydrate kinase [Candidatus Woesearchaeota archaeon]|nr:PfkB family carbohydrate kinase [Candidatus Woesearchaeota archaeon]
MMPTVHALCVEPVVDVFKEHTIAGGGGVHVSVGAMELGLPVHLHLVTGNDADGNFLAEHIGGLFSRNARAPTELSHIVGGHITRRITYADNGDVQDYTPPQDLSDATIAGVEASIESASSGDFLVLSGATPPNKNMLYGDLAREHAEQRVVVDTSDPLAMRYAAKEQLLFMKATKQELKGALNTLSRVYDKRCVMEALIPDRMEMFLVTNGKSGLTLYGENTCVRATPPAAHASPVGAGDSTVAAAILAIAKEKPLEDVARFAAAYGSATAGKQTLGNIHEFQDRIPKVSVLTRSMEFRI